MLALLLGASILGAGLVIDMALDDDDDANNNADQGTDTETGNEENGDLIDVALSGDGAEFFGTELNERIMGTNGADSVDGGAGNDILNGRPARGAAARWSGPTRSRAPARRRCGARRSGRRAA